MSISSLSAKAAKLVAQGEPRGLSNNFGARAAAQKASGLAGRSRNYMGNDYTRNPAGMLYGPAKYSEKAELFEKQRIPKHRDRLAEELLKSKPDLAVVKRSIVMLATGYPDKSKGGQLQIYTNDGTGTQHRLQAQALSEGLTRIKSELSDDFRTLLDFVAGDVQPPKLEPADLAKDEGRKLGAELAAKLVKKHGPTTMKVMGWEMQMLAHDPSLKLGMLKVLQPAMQELRAGMKLVTGDDRAKLEEAAVRGLIDGLRLAGAMIEGSPHKPTARQRAFAEEANRLPRQPEVSAAPPAAAPAPAIAAATASASAPKKNSYPAGKHFEEALGSRITRFMDADQLVRDARQRCASLAVKARAGAPGSKERAAWEGVARQAGAHLKEAEDAITAQTDRLARFVRRAGRSEARQQSEAFRAGKIKPKALAGTANILRQAAGLKTHSEWMAFGREHMPHRVKQFKGAKMEEAMQVRLLQEYVKGYAGAIATEIALAKSQAKPTDGQWNFIAAFSGVSAADFKALATEKS